MYKEKCQTGSISRVIFSPMYTVCVVIFLYTILIYLLDLILLIFCVG